MGWWANWGKEAVGKAGQLYEGYREDQQSRDNRRAAGAMSEADRQLERDLAHRGGWDIVDPTLEYANEEARRIYDERRAMGGYRDNVSRPGGGGMNAGERADIRANQGMRDVADRARDIAMGSDRGGEAATNYVEGVLGGKGPRGGSADMHRGAYDAASASRFNPLVDRTFGAAEGMFGANQPDINSFLGDRELAEIARNFMGGLANEPSQGVTGSGGPIVSGGINYSGKGSSSSRGGGGGAGAGNIRGMDINLDDPRFKVDPDDPRLRVDPDDPRFSIADDPRLKISKDFSVDPTGGQINWQGVDPVDFVRQAQGSGPVGVAGDIRAMLDDPFAKSNPYLEQMISQSTEDIEGSHAAQMGRLAELAGGSAFGGSGFQLAQSQAAKDALGQISRATTGMRYQDYNDRLGDMMQAMQLGAGLDSQAAAQAVQMQIHNDQTLTDVEKANLSARVQRELANQGTDLDKARLNQGTALQALSGDRGAQQALAQGNLAAYLSAQQGNQAMQGRLAQGNQSTQLGARGQNLDAQARAAARSASSAASAQNAQLTREGYDLTRQMGGLEAMLGLRGQNLQGLGLQGELGMGALGAMGNMAQLGGQLNQGGAALMGDVAGSMGGLELGAANLAPQITGANMANLGSAFGMQEGVYGADARAAQMAAQQRANAASRQQAYDQNALNWDFNAGANALQDLIQQGSAIGSHIQGPVGARGSGVAAGFGGALPPGPLAGTQGRSSGGTDILSNAQDAYDAYNRFSGGGLGPNAFSNASAEEIASWGGGPGGGAGAGFSEGAFDYGGPNFSEGPFDYGQNFTEGGEVAADAVVNQGSSWFPGSGAGGGMAGMGHYQNPRTGQWVPANFPGAAWVGGSSASFSGADTVGGRAFTQPWRGPKSPLGP